MPIDYSKGKIYKLTTIHNPNLVYYGSTINPLCKRKGGHKEKFKLGDLSCKSSQLFQLGINDVKITLVENVICVSKEELLQRERFYIENNNCVNKYIPNRTKEDIQEYNKKYMELNKEKIKKYRELNKDKKKLYIEKNKENINKTVKIYYETNKDKIREYKKEYYKNNKDKYNNNRKKNLE